MFKDHQRFLFRLRSFLFYYETQSLKIWIGYAYICSIQSQALAHYLTQSYMWKKYFRFSFHKLCWVTVSTLENNICLSRPISRTWWTVALKAPQLIRAERFYTVKKVSNFPVTSRDVTSQTLPAGNNWIILHQESLVSDIPDRDGKIRNRLPFYSVWYCNTHTLEC
jgi:hypothetical protein